MEAEYRSASSSGSVLEPRRGETSQRPRQLLIRTADRLTCEKVKAFCRAVLQKALYVKGAFLGKDEVWYEVEGAGEHVRMQPMEEPGREIYFVVVQRANIELRGIVRRSWMMHCGVCFTLHH